MTTLDITGLPDEKVAYLKTLIERWKKGDADVPSLIGAWRMANQVEGYSV